MTGVKRKAQRPEKKVKWDHLKLYKDTSVSTRMHCCSNICRTCTAVSTCTAVTYMHCSNIHTCSAESLSTDNDNAPMDS